MKGLVTGFEPFGGDDFNPSQWLAEHCGRPFRILPVTYAGVDSALQELNHVDFDYLLLIGLHGKASKFHLEQVARNHIGNLPDNHGIIQGPAKIDPTQPQQIAATLWRGSALHQETEYRTLTVDAGSYLCNYSLFQALRTFPAKPIGFLHVPRTEIMSLDLQLEELRLLLDDLEQDLIEG